MQLGQFIDMFSSLQSGVNIQKPREKMGLKALSH